MCLVEFDCRHRFAGGFALDVAFQISHRFTALFGPSGSGKTTILSIIAGLLRPQSGNVRLAGRSVVDTARGTCLAPERRRVGVVFQDFLLFPHLTVEDNLRYGQRRRRKAPCAVNFARVVDVLEIGQLLKRHPHGLSGGERQRVALGRALLSGPELLLMDEPLASLDAALKIRILAYLERVVGEWGIPTLFVTHGQVEVRRAAEWVVVVEQGRIVSSGPPEEALSQPRPLGWSNATGPVNLLRIQEIACVDGHLTGLVGHERVFLAGETVPSTSPSFVQFLPTDVILCRHDVDGLSARNRLRGRVCKVVAADRAVFVAIDVGQILWAEITPQAAAELDLHPGGEVVCLLKAHNLTLVD